MKRKFTGIVMIILAGILLTGCGGRDENNTSDSNAVPGVTSVAVSGTETSQPAKKRDSIFFGSRLEEGVPHCLYQWDGEKLENVLPEPEENLYEYLSADEHWIYYSVLCGNNLEIHRVSVVEKDGKRSIDTGKIETILIEEEGHSGNSEIRDCMVVQGKYVVALIGNYKLWIYSVEKESQRTVVIDKKYGLSVKTNSQLIGSVGNTVFFFLGNYETTMKDYYCYDLDKNQKHFIKTFKKSLSYENHISFISDEKRNECYYLEEEYSPVIERYNIKSQKTEKVTERENVLQALTKVLGVEKKQIHKYFVTQIVVDRERLYLQITAYGTGKKKCWRNYIFSTETHGKSKIKYEKEITEQMHKNSEEITIWEDGDFPCIVNFGGVLKVHNGKWLFEIMDVNTLDYECQPIEINELKFGCYDEENGYFQKSGLEDANLYFYADAESINKVLDGLYTNTLVWVAEDYYGANLFNYLVPEGD